MTKASGGENEKNPSPRKCHYCRRDGMDLYLTDQARPACEKCMKEKGLKIMPPGGCQERLSENEKC